MTGYLPAEIRYTEESQHTNEIERVGLRQFAHTHTTNGHFGHTGSEKYQYWDLKAQQEPVLFQSHERALGLSR